MTGTNRDVDLNLPDINPPGIAIRRVAPARRNALRPNRTRHPGYQSLLCSVQHRRRAIPQHSGQTRKVLFEGEDRNGTMDGYTDNYIKVTTSFRSDWVNQIVDFKL